MADEVGRVDLGLNLDYKQFSRQLNGVASKGAKMSDGAFKNMGSSLGSSMSAGMTAAVVAGVAVLTKKLANFISDSINAGSDLIEVQNVVDVAFNNMSGSVEKFAQEAITSFGMSETSAKKYLGTMGIMSKSMGFTEQQAFGMSKAVTGLVGDVASFYNLDHEAAYDKLKAIWTGETEAIRSLGVVMTQTALDQYALNNGFGKTTAKMTEQQKVMLRYQYVMDALSGAMGDFARTSDSWANQSRVLSLQMQQFKATMGQGFINMFTPIIKVVNTLMAKLQVLANYFKAFSELVFGTSSSLGGVVEDTTTAASSINDMANSTKNVGNAVANTAKKVARSLAGFDQINKVTENNNDASGGGGVSTPGLGFGSTDLGFDTVFDDTTSAVDAIKEKVQAFLDWFSGAFGPYLDPFVESCKQCWESIKGLLSMVVDWVIRIYNAISPWLTLIVQGFLMCFTGCMNTLSGLIDFIVGVFTGDWDKAWNGVKMIFQGLGEFLSGTVATIGSVIMGAFAGAWEAVKIVWEACEPFFSAIWGGIVAIFSVCKDVLSAFFDSAWQAIKDTWSVVVDWFSRLWGNIKTVFSVCKTVLSGFFSAAWTAIKTTWSVANKFFGTVWSGIKTTFSTTKSVLSGFFTGAYSLVKSAWNGAGKYFSGIYSGIKSAFSTTGTWFKSCFSTALTNIKTVFNPITKWFSTTFSGLKKIASDTWDGILKLFEKGGKIFSGVTDGIANVFKSIVNSLITGINKVISIPFNTINKSLNGIRGIDILGLKPFQGLWDNNPVAVPKIPKLAQGGYVKANTPQLAMIGDNRHQGEVVAPEDKLQEMANKAAGNNSDLLQQILAAILGLDLTLDGKKITKSVINGINQITTATNNCPIKV